MSKGHLIVKPGQVWERWDGSRFTVEHIANGYADYWLSRGSRPQFRSIRLDRLTGPSRNYRLVRAEDRAGKEQTQKEQSQS